MAGLDRRVGRGGVHREYILFLCSVDWEDGGNPATGAMMSAFSLPWLEFHIQMAPEERVDVEPAARK